MLRESLYAGEKLREWYLFVEQIIIFNTIYLGNLPVFLFNGKPKQF